MPSTNNPTATAPDYTITTGFSGTPNILPALTANGYVEEAYRMFACTDYASWLYPVKLGSTSMWERWNSYELAFQQGGESSMNSFNHFALGSVGSWLYEYHLGITTDSGRGYKEFALQPLPGGAYTSAEGTVHSNYGPIRSAWSADKGAITAYECSVPANTSATLYLPVEMASVEGFENSEWIAFEGMTTRNGKQVAVFKLSSGNHSFKLNDTKWSAKTK
jgi:alpha-L-rhamnosidase